MSATSLKISDKVERLKNIFAEKLIGEPKRRPNEIVIEVTCRCNLDCSFCFNKICIKKRSLVDSLSYSDLTEIIDNISQSSIKQVRFTGGEPTLRNDFFRILKYAKSKDLTIWLNTNATLIGRSAAGIISKHVENVLVQLNACYRKDEVSLTGENLFDRRMRGIKNLKLAGLKNVRAGTVATQKNIRRLEAFHRIVKKLKLNNWELFRPIPLNKINITSKDVEILIEKLAFINKTNESNYRISNALPICSYDPEKVDAVSEGACFDDGHTRMVVDFRGFLKPAYYMFENVGDPKEPIMKGWKNKIMKDMRRLKCVPGICKGCKYLRKCKGGSRITAKLINGSYNGSDYLAQPEKYSDILFS